MKTFCIIPAKPLKLAKARLSRRFTPAERAQLSLAMTADVLEAVTAAPSLDGCMVVSPDFELRGLVNSFGAAFIEEERAQGVNRAVARGTKAVLARNGDASLVVPNDVPLVSPFDVERILHMGRGRAVVITPSRRLDGTNALLRKPPHVINTHYDADSFRSHAEEARRKRVRLQLYLNWRVMLDIDSPPDVTEFLRTPSDTETFKFLSRFRRHS